MQKNVPLEWPQDANQQAVAMTNVMAVQATQDGLIVTFGQASPPLLTGSDEERKQNFDAMKSVAPAVLGRFIIPTNRLADYVKAFTVGASQTVALARTPSTESEEQKANG